MAEIRTLARKPSIPPGSPPDGPSPPAAILRLGASRLAAAGLADPARWLLVAVSRQSLHLIEQGRPGRSWPISTAAAGIDNRDGSGGTPPGVHRIARRIGSGQPLGAVFVSREPTGEIWTGPGSLPGTVIQDLILTRILTLEGLEDGINRGQGVDSHARYIYLHGTNQEDRLGEAVSHGCIRLANRAMLEVFDLVEEGDPVVIV